MSFMVTGGTGFIASHIARRLVGEGEHVVLFDLYPDEKMIEGIRSKVSLFQGDVTSMADLVRAMRVHRVKTVIHTAYCFTRPAQKDPLRATRINCEGTVNVFEASKLLDCDKVVWASSVAVYGSKAKYKRFPLTEEDPTYPSTLYGACKVYNEFTSQLYRDQFGLDTIGIRVSGAYGWGMWKRRDSLTNFLFDLFQKGGRGKPCKVKGGNMLFDWHYVKDIAEAFLLACRKNTKHGIFNAPGTLHPVKEAARIFKEIVPNPAIKVSRDMPEGENLESDYLPLNSHLIDHELGYRPRHSLREGIQDYLQDLRSMGDT